MQTSNIPGYSEIFPSGIEQYDEVVSGLASDTVIKLCAAINNELTCPEQRQEIQGRLNYHLVSRFTKEQQAHLQQSFIDYKAKANDNFRGMIFFRRYLVAMILKELANYREVDDRDDSPVHEYQFFKAYLLVIDEVNQGDHGDLDFSNLDKTDPLTTYKMLWMPVIRQFEYNEKGNIIFETLKTACLLKYTAENYTEFLKEYLGQFGFKSPGELLSSYNQIYRVTEVYDPKAMLRKFSLINPLPDVNIKHLESQAINAKIGTKLTFSDLKKQSVFHSKQREKYVILDNYLSQRKVFRGPYFELYHQTSLKKQEKKGGQEVFNKYSQNVADALEARCLRPILTLLGEKECDKMYFDDGTKNVPDGYLRIGNIVLLFEYKAYFFPEKLAQKPNFEALKKYFDDRFIVNEGGKEKGINQLKKQIDLIYQDKFDFDKELGKIATDQKLLIYPIITYNDFNFSLSGLNVYLHKAFFSILEDKYAEKMTIMPLMLMNLETILDIVMTEQGVTGLRQHIYNFINLVTESEANLQVSKSQSDFLKAHASFDEIYNWLFVQKLENPDSIQPVLEKLLEIAGLSFSELNKPL